MNKNTFNYFRNAFALIGFFIIACSVATNDDPSLEPELPTFSNIGKYQTAVTQRGTIPFMVVINTETGVSKTYEWDGWDKTWKLEETANITFNH